jgi:antitoxin (DNA-binding transcriptional repressor) of toxin-antitoxin stability system
MTKVYSTWEAKTKFSEIVRKVRGGETVYVAYRGERVAEVRPISREEQPLEERLDNLERSGVVTRATESPSGMKPLVRKRGALARFLESRD